MAPTDLDPTTAMFVDLARVALSGDDNGTRQLVRRVIRNPPADVQNPAQLRSQLSAVLAASPKSASNPLRGGEAKALLDGSESEFAWVQLPALAEEPILEPELAAAIAALIGEHQNPDRLASFGLEASSAVLFTGPPGVGKTLTAGYVASQLGIPLITVNLASLMSSLMGKTAQNLQGVIEMARRETCVLFLDEFDALAKSRDDMSDIGEVKRLVNVILQQMDMWPTGSLLIAATNHPQLLDPAVHRRFDSTIEFVAPRYDERLQFLRRHDVLTRSAASEEELSILALISQSWSLAELDNWISRIARRAVLEGENTSTTPAELTYALVEKASKHARDWSTGSATRRAQLATLASRHLGWTHRTIGAWLGVSHVTVGKYIAQESSSKAGATKQTD
jgi:AAA+ superfamily predicted ATPase